MGVGLYTPASGSKRRWWTVHVGVGSYSLALGGTRRRLAQNEGIGPYTLALGSRRRSWSYTLAFSSKYRCWVVHAGVRLQRPAFSSWHMRSQITAVKRGRRHTNMRIGASISRHRVVLGVAPGLRCRYLRLGCLGHSWFLNIVISGERRDGRVQKGTYIVNVESVS
jgi:hypothetical protein